MRATADDFGILAEAEDELLRRVVEWQDALERTCINVNVRKQKSRYATRSWSRNIYI